MKKNDKKRKKRKENKPKQKQTNKTPFPHGAYLLEERQKISTIS